jgi:hypothetical protein
VWLVDTAAESVLQSLKAYPFHYLNITMAFLYALEVMLHARPCPCVPSQCYTHVPVSIITAHPFHYLNITMAFLYALEVCNIVLIFL